MQQRPVIGVIACERQVEGEPAQAVKHRYLDAVERFAEAAPVIIATNQAGINAADIVQRLDAVLLTGSGSNIEPTRYGATAPAQPPLDRGRDIFSQALILAAVAAGKPVFGICRGLQEINVALGGTLRDLRVGQATQHHHAPDTAGLEDTFSYGHTVSVAAGSMLQRLAGSQSLGVNSVHYQAIDRLAPGLAVNAEGPGGVIEAVSATATAAPVFAVQWHPEWRPAERAHDLAFWTYLGQAARADYLSSAPLEARA